MAENATNRLGVIPYGADDALVVGNPLLYPRRVVLEVLRLLLQQENLFTPTTADGTSQERNPFLLKIDADGNPEPGSRIVLADFGSEKLMKEETRPRIIVERGGGQFSGSGFSQQNANEPWTGYSNRSSDIYETSLQIRCVARHKLSSEMLSWIASFTLWAFRSVILRKSELFQMGPPSVGPTVPDKADADVEQYTTSVSMSIKQTINWKLSRISGTIINDICIQMSST